MAPPTKLTPEISAKICDAIRAGNYIETAAAYAGISRETLYTWLKKGARNPSGKYGTFNKVIQQAMASSEIRDVALIAKAATDQWQAAAWRLERRYPDKWGRREKQELSGPQGGPIQTVAKVVVLPPLDDSSSETASDLGAKSWPTDPVS